jgi:branched-chain amino acid aminotransferase
MTLLKEMGLKVEERPLGMDEVINAYDSGELKEVFGTGTAATISMIKELYYKGKELTFDIDTWKVAPALKKHITDIREGRVADTHGWMHAV